MVTRELGEKKITKEKIEEKVITCAATQGTQSTLSWRTTFKRHQPEVTSWKYPSNSEAAKDGGPIVIEPCVGNLCRNPGIPKQVKMADRMSSTCKEKEKKEEQKKVGERKLDEEELRVLRRRPDNIQQLQHGQISHTPANATPDLGRVFREPNLIVKEEIPLDWKRQQ